MQELFENIIEKLETESDTAIDKMIEQEEEKDMAFYDGYDEGCSKAIEIVKQEAEKFCRDTNVGSNGWIPCSEQLPTTEEYQRGNGRFLVTDGNRTYEAEFDIYQSHTFGKSRMATDWFITDKCVTHWQNEPLPPQPYQSKGE